MCVWGGGGWVCSSLQWWTYQVKMFPKRYDLVTGSFVKRQVIPESYNCAWLSTDFKNI